MRLVRLVGKGKRSNISLEGQFKQQHVYESKRYDVLQFAIYHHDVMRFFSRLKQQKP